jgi:hypothetical protein
MLVRLVRESEKYEILVYVRRVFATYRPKRFII